MSAFALFALLLIVPRAHAQVLASLPSGNGGIAIMPEPEKVSQPSDDLDLAAVADGAGAAEAEIASPSVEWPLKHLYCVEYARLRSGLAVFGDAKLWWSRARNLYEEFAQPAVDAVMVFSGSHRIRKGHVAIVTKIVNPREVIVDHANWQNRGEIDHNTPVLDVSTKNDWSAVRVWDINSSQWGARIYRLSGFIAGHAQAAAATGS
ncbi:MAG: CHAP domain-containing protein [Rhizomicrobium sp.]